MSVRENLYKSLIENKWEARPATTHFDRPCLGMHGSGWVCSGSGGSRSRCALTGILEPQGAVPPDSNSTWRGWVYRLAPEALLIREMPTDPKAFLDPLGVSRLRTCAQTHLKKALYHIRPFGGTLDKYCVISHWFVQRLFSGLSGSGLSTPGFNPPWGDSF